MSLSRTAGNRPGLCGTLVVLNPLNLAKKQMVLDGLPLFNGNCHSLMLKQFLAPVITYNELYEEGLIDDEFDAGYVAEVGHGHTVIGGETAHPENYMNFGSRN